MKFLELKSTITEENNSKDGLNRREDTSGEITRELQHKSVENITMKDKEKKLETRNNNIKDTLHMMSSSNIPVNIN